MFKSIAITSPNSLADFLNNNPGLEVVAVIDRSHCLHLVYKEPSVAKNRESEVLTDIKKTENKTKKK